MRARSPIRSHLYCLSVTLDSIYAVDLESEYSSILCLVRCRRVFLHTKGGVLLF